MAVKKLVRPLGKVMPKTDMKLRQDLSGLTLPDMMKPADDNILNYTFLLYGREKIGKTTICASFPKAIFLSTEPGIKGLSVYAFNHEHGGVVDWSIMRKGIDLLVAEGPGRFKTVIIDTVDRAYDYCLDWVCENRGIEYPGEGADGKNDYGKSWKAVRSEFLTQIYRLTQVGFGLVFTSHAKEQEYGKGADKFTRIFPSMSNQARQVVEALVDFFFYAEYIKGPDGENNRVFICQGDEFIWAGARATPGDGNNIGNPFPQFVPMIAINGFEVFAAAFRGEAVGIDPRKMVASKSTSKTGQGFIMRERAKAARPGNLKGGQGSETIKPKVVKRIG